VSEREHRKDCGKDDQDEKKKLGRRNANDRAGQSVRSEIEKPAGAQAFSDQAADHFSIAA
jgi:hypothetical protein